MFNVGATTLHVLLQGQLIEYFCLDVRFLSIGLLLYERSRVILPTGTRSIRLVAKQARRLVSIHLGDPSSTRSFDESIAASIRYSTVYPEWANCTGIPTSVLWDLFLISGHDHPSTSRILSCIPLNSSEISFLTA